MARKTSNFAARIDPEIHKLAKIKAAEEGRSIQEVAELLLKKWIEGEVELPPPCAL